jgi:hypothetical protein
VVIVATGSGSGTDVGAPSIAPEIDHSFTPDSPLPSANILEFAPEVVAAAARLLAAAGIEGSGQVGVLTGWFAELSALAGDPDDDAASAFRDNIGPEQVTYVDLVNKIFGYTEPMSDNVWDSVDRYPAADRRGASAIGSQSA